MAIYRDNKELNSVYANGTELSAIYWGEKFLTKPLDAKFIYLKYYPNGYKSKSKQDQITPDEWTELREKDVIAKTGYPSYVSSTRTVKLDLTEIEKIYDDYYFSLSPEKNQFGSAPCTKLKGILTAAKNGVNDLEKRMIVYPKLNTRGVAAFYFHNYYKLVRMSLSNNVWKCDNLTNDYYIEFLRNPLE